MNDLKSHVGGVIDILDRGSTPLTSTLQGGAKVSTGYKEHD